LTKPNKLVPHSAAIRCSVGAKAISCRGRATSMAAASPDAGATAVSVDDGTIGRSCCESLCAGIVGEIG
jgi:hypothetical protein